MWGLVGHVKGSGFLHMVKSYWKVLSERMTWSHLWLKMIMLPDEWWIDSTRGRMEAEKLVRQYYNSLSKIWLWCGPAWWKWRLVYSLRLEPEAFAAGLYAGTKKKSRECPPLMICLGPHITPCCCTKRQLRNGVPRCWVLSESLFCFRTWTRSEKKMLNSFSSPLSFPFLSIQKTKTILYAGKEAVIWISALWI